MKLKATFVGISLLLCPAILAAGLKTVPRVRISHVAAKGRLYFVFESSVLEFRLWQDETMDFEEAVRLVREQKYTQAERFFSNYHQAHPQNAAAMFYLGQIAFFRSDFKKSVDWLKKAVALAPENSNYHLWLGRAYGQQAMRASIFKKFGRAKKAKKEFETSVRLDSTNLEARFDLFQYLLLAPGVAGGNKKKARQQCEEINRLSPYQGHIAFARLYEQEKKFDLAKQEYLTLVTAYPDSLRAYILLAAYESRRKQFDQTREVLLQAIEKFPGDRADLLYQLGLNYQSLQEYDLALESFEKVVAIDSTAYNAWYQIGRTGAFSGRFLQKAENALKRYIQKAPKGSNYPSLAWAHYRLGMVYQQQKRFELARAEYQKALSLDSKHKQAKKALKVLKKKMR